MPRRVRVGFAFLLVAAQAAPLGIANCSDAVLHRRLKASFKGKRIPWPEAQAAAPKRAAQAAVDPAAKAVRASERAGALAVESSCGPAAFGNLAGVMVAELELPDRGNRDAACCLECAMRSGSCDFWERPSDGGPVRPQPLLLMTPSKAPWLTLLRLALCLSAPASPVGVLPQGGVQGLRSAVAAPLPCGPAGPAHLLHPPPPCRVCEALPRGAALRPCGTAPADATRGLPRPARGWDCFYPHASQRGCHRGTPARALCEPPRPPWRPR